MAISSFRWLEVRNEKMCKLQGTLFMNFARHTFKKRLFATVNTEGTNGFPKLDPTFSSTTDEKELSKFQRVSSTWWNRDGPMKALHSMNRLRVPFIRDGIISSKKIDSEIARGPKPLTDVSILDVGCGGGILSESLCRLGAEVTGIDAVPENVEIAQGHALADPFLSGLQYIVGTVEDHKETYNEHYDAVVASEVIEHVENQQFFVATCASLVKPGGSLFFTTINRTQLSWITAIIGAEYIFRVLPQGIHNWNKFVTPDEIETMLTSAGCQLLKKHGMFYNALNNNWMWSNLTSVNYAVHAVKVMEEKEVQESPEKLDQMFSGDRRPPISSDVTGQHV